MQPGEDSIFFELEWLNLAIESESIGREDLRILRGSRVWRLVHPRRSRFSGRALAVASTAASTAVLLPRPSVAAPASTRSVRYVQMAASVQVVDAATDQPLDGVRIVDRHGRLIGLTKADGKAVVQLNEAPGGAAVVQKEGYRSIPLVVSALQPGSTELVNLFRQPAFKASHPPAEAMALQPHPQPVTVRKPSPPAPGHVASAKRPAKRPAKPIAVKATPLSTSKVAVHSPTREPSLEPSRAMHPRPARAPKARPQAAHKTARKTVTVAARPVVEPKAVGRHVESAPPSMYRVRLGDSLWRISARQLGNPNLWGELYRANRHQIHRPDLIHPGQLLRIPTPVLALAAHHGQGAGRVTVRAGDTLWRLAAMHLGNGERWPQIYRLNKHEVSNPGFIYPGEILVLPRG